MLLQNDSQPYQSHLLDRERIFWQSLYGDYATGWTTEESGLDFRQGKYILLLSITSRPNLGPTQVSIQWISGAVPSGITRQRLEAYF
jgi:hypothetical protein